MTDKKSITFDEIVNFDPAKLEQFSKEDLVDWYIRSRQVEEEMRGMREAISLYLTEKMEADAEIVGDYSVSKVKRYSFPEVSLEEAKELGAVKETKDETLLKKILLKGADLKVKITEYLLIKVAEKPKND